MGGSIPLPALAARAPQEPDLLGNVGKVLGVQQAQQGIQAGQLENQARQQALQLQQQKVKDQKTVTDLFVKNNGDLDQTVTDAAKAGVTPETLQALQLHALDVKSKTLDLASKQGAEATRQADLVQGAYSTVAQSKPEERPALYQQELMGLQKQGVDVSKMPMQYPGDQAFKVLGATVQGYTKQLAQAVQASEVQKNQGAAVASQATAGKDNAETAYYQQNPALGAPGVPAETVQMRDAINSGAIKSPSQWSAFKAKQEAAATQPYKIQTSIAEGQAKAAMDAEIARGSNAALAQVPPHLIGQATTAATKAGEDYAQAQSVSQRLQAMMDDARKGNVVSYQLLPQEGALQLTTSQGVHRINMAEIQNYGGGSLWQKLEGHIGKALTGQSIPGSVLNDMEEMQKIQAEGSQKKYENALKTVNQNYGSKFEPVTMDPLERNQPAQPAAAGGDFFSQFGGKAR